jgi:hypothetical protein
VYSKLKNAQIKRGRAIRESIWLLAVVVFCLIATFYTEKWGLDRKWVTALLGTVVPFGFVTYVNRRRLARWSFWISLFVCLAIHLLAVWAVFQYVLSGFRTFSPLLWYPVMLLEMFALLIVEKRLEEKLTGERYTMTVRI